MRANLQPAAGPEDPFDVPSRQGPRTAVRGTRAVLEAIESLLPEPLQPLVGSRPRDADRSGCCRHGPAVLEDPGNEKQPSERGETSPTMGHESLLPVRSFGQPQTVQGGSRLSTTSVGTTPSRRKRSLSMSLRDRTTSTATAQQRGACERATW